MTLTQQKQRMLAIIALLVFVSLVILAFISFEVAQHTNGLWQVNRANVERFADDRAFKLQFVETLKIGQGTDAARCNERGT